MVLTMTNLCQLAQDWRGTIPTDGVMVESKIDGFRALAMRGVDGKRYLFSRNGVPIEGASHILDRLALLEDAAGMPLVIDGEFQVDGTLAATKAWFERGWKQGGNAGVFHAFDVMPWREWQEGGCNAEAYRRKAWLKQLFVESEPRDDGWTWAEGSRGAVPPIPVYVIEDAWMFDADAVAALARFEWDRGGEGLMLKDPMAPYRRKRCDAWQKVKVENMHKWQRRAA